MKRLICKPQPDKETSILIGAGIRTHLEEELRNIGADGTVVALVDAAVRASHPEVISDSWRCIELPGGEACKTFAVLEDVLRQMAQWHLDRDTVLVAIGGGTIGDLGGLVATLFLRGIDLVQVPTTLLAMLDSSVGGKTAINIEEGKNLVGSFWPPRVMLADVEFAHSLPREQLLSGLAEAIKMGIGFNLELFELLEAHREAILEGDTSLLTKVVAMAVQDKIDTVESDPLETTGRRRCLNLGHTLAHALEALGNFRMLHGHAVAQGLHFCLGVAVDRDLLAGDDAERCHALLEAYGFRREPLPPAQDLAPFFARDKKMSQGQLHFVVPTAIGACRTDACAPDSLAFS